MPEGMQDKDQGKTTNQDDPTSQGKTTDQDKTTDAGKTISTGGLTDDAGDGGGQPKPGPPEKYDFKIPDGQEPSPVLEEFSGVARELGLPQDAAQKLLDLHSKVITANIESAVSAHETQMAEWTKQSQNDKEIGGANLVASAAAAKVALDRMGTPQLVELLDGTGLGNHPEVLRFFSRVGKALSEDQLHGKPKADTGDLLSRIYTKTAALDK